MFVVCCFCCCRRKAKQKICNIYLKIALICISIGLSLIWIWWGKTIERKQLDNFSLTLLVYAMMHSLLAKLKKNDSIIEHMSHYSQQWTIKTFKNYPNLHDRTRFWWSNKLQLKNFFPFLCKYLYFRLVVSLLLTKDWKSEQLFSHLSPYVLLWSTNKEKSFHCISFPFVVQILWNDGCVSKREKNGFKCGTALLKCGASLEGWWWCNCYIFIIFSWVRWFYFQFNESKCQEVQERILILFCGLLYRID